MQLRSAAVRGGPRTALPSLLSSAAGELCARRTASVAAGKLRSEARESAASLEEGRRQYIRRRTAACCAPGAVDAAGRGEASKREVRRAEQAAGPGLHRLERPNRPFSPSSRESALGYLCTVAYTYAAQRL